ncbi:MAG: homoserine dehydrogenase [Ruminococcaceae bacterium]|nr:homoserine dehydrogenase [Oscillospiraceae bacterium]
MIKVAIMGYGVVGSGVYEVIRKNEKSIAKKTGGKTITVKHILDLRDFPDHEQPQLFTKSFEDIVNDPEVAIVVEVMGGLTPAYEYSKAALLAGKNVVTSNKALVAEHGTELMQIAKEQNVNYLFEASVGGGIPIIRPLSQCLAANELEEIYGILNGTTNFILTKMITDGADFEEALAEAQRLGYAERNPEADVEGYDACRKIAILASLASGKYVNWSTIETEGITKITRRDVAFAEKFQAVIKLIGHAKITEDEKVYARVSPMLIPKGHQLADVNGVFNAILVKGDSIGDVMFYGQGAGKLPTASAVVADVIDAAKHIHTNKLITWKEVKENFMVDPDTVVARFFVKANAAEVMKDFPGAEPLGDEAGTWYFVTEAMPEGEFKKKLNGRGDFIRVLEG